MSEPSEFEDPLDDDAPVFLELEPPPWTIRGLATLLIVLFVVTVLGAALVELPETVTSRFVLAPEHGTDPVRARRAGTVLWVGVVEGQTVVQNETLFTVRSESIGDRTSELRGLEAQQRGFEESLANEVAEFESRKRADTERLRSLTNRLSDLDGMVGLKRDALRLSREVVDRYRGLHDQELISSTDLASYELAAKRTELELEELSSERAKVDADLQQIPHESEAREAAHRERVRDQHEQVERTEIRIAALVEGLADTKEGQLSVSAPCAGTVLQLPVSTVGTFVQAGDVLAELVCSGTLLRARLIIPQADVARIEPGQGVKFLYDAFPFQRYGVRFGSLRWVSPASAEENGQRIFRALADLDDTSIVVKGKERPLMAGMGGLAKIVVGRRTLIAYAFEPLLQLRESVTDAPARSNGAQADVAPSSARADGSQ